MPFLQIPCSKVKQNNKKKRNSPSTKSPDYVNGIWKKGVTLCLRRTASLTVEASLSLSLFLFAVVTLLIPLKIMDCSRRIQAVLESVCEDASQYAYVKYKLTSGDQKDIPETGGWQTKFSDYFEGAGLKAYAGMMVRSHIDAGIVESISFARSRIMESDENLDLVMDYKMKLPFPVFRIKSLDLTARSSRRAWTGRKGGFGNGVGGGSADKKGEVVYVGKGSTKYHRQRTCHYLYNDISAVSYDRVGAYRNAGGGRYKPCSRCSSLAQAGAAVYIMPSGNSYHSDRYCSAIVAYVKAVPLSTVEYLGACSYCSR